MLTSKAWFNVYRRTVKTANKPSRPGKVICLSCGCKFRTLVPGHSKVREMNATCESCQRKAKPQATVIKPNNFLAKITWTKSKRKFLR